MGIFKGFYGPSSSVLLTFHAIWKVPMVKKLSTVISGVPYSLTYNLHEVHSFSLTWSAWFKNQFSTITWLIYTIAISSFYVIYFSSEYSNCYVLWYCRWWLIQGLNELSMVPYCWHLIGLHCLFSSDIGWIHIYFRTDRAKYCLPSRGKSFRSKLFNVCSAVKVDQSEIKLSQSIDK